MAPKTNNKMRHFGPRTVDYPASRRGSVGKQIGLSTAELACRTLMDRCCRRLAECMGSLCSCCRLSVHDWLEDSMNLLGRKWPWVARGTGRPDND